MRSALLSVRELDRSVAFYREVAGFREVLREDQVAVLERAGRPTTALFLREAYRGATRSPQQSLGVRTLSFEVGSIEELDRIEERLRSAGAFRDRGHFVEGEAFEYLRGHDPDRLALTFVADETGSPLPEEHYRSALAIMYTLDL